MSSFDFVEGGYLQYKKSQGYIRVPYGLGEYIDQLCEHGGVYSFMRFKPVGTDLPAANVILLPWEYITNG